MSKLPPIDITEEDGAWAFANDPGYHLVKERLHCRERQLSAEIAAHAQTKAENAALREAAKAAERKGMERALAIVRGMDVLTCDNDIDSDLFALRRDIEAAIRAAMEE